MKKNSLSKNGLSMSQAQSVSNLCNQRAIEIDRILNSINNASKTVKADGEELLLLPGVPVPTNIVELLMEKSSLTACQAFLMENIKAKADLIKSIGAKVADTSDIVWPEKVIVSLPVVIPFVTEEYGWEQLTIQELSEYYQAEATAAVIGKFIHKGGKLDLLRNELISLPNIDWLSLEEGKKTAVKIIKHNEASELLKLYEDLAAMHRTHESRVNYFKAKVKNLTAEKNTEIAKTNELANTQYSEQEREATLKYQEAYREVAVEIRKRNDAVTFEKQTALKEVVNLRIEVDPRFQSVVDKFITKE